MDTKVKLIIEAATDQAKKAVQGFAQASSQGFDRAEKSAKRFTQGLQDTWDQAKKAVQGFAQASSQGFDRAEKSAKRFTQGLQDTWAKAKSAWVEIGAAALALNKAYGLAYDAARFAERETAFANMAASHGAAADQIVSDLKRISAGTIDTMTIMEKAGTAIMLGIQAEKLDELMKIARASTKITGQTVSQAFSDISLAVGRQSRMILDNLGIIVRVEEANDQYAATLGKVSSQLTDAEKKQAFLNATLEAGEDIVRRVGTIQDSAAEKIQRYQARWKNAAIWIGKAFLSVAQGIDLVFDAAAASARRITATIASSMAWVGGILSKLPGQVGESARQWTAAVKEIEKNTRAAADKGIARMSETWDALVALWKKSEPVRKGVTKDINDQGGAAAKTAEKVKALADASKTDAQKRAEATEAMYKESGINADAYYREQVNKLSEQARAWQDAGVNIEEINKYMFDKIEKMEAEALGKGETLVSDWLNQIKYHTATMVSDLEQKEALMQKEIAKVAASVKDLNGAEIGIQVRLYDDVFWSELARLKAGLAQAGGLPAPASGTGESAAASGTGTATIYEGGNTTNVIISEKVSRSDVTNIVTEADRQANRS